MGYYMHSKCSGQFVGKFNTKKMKEKHRCRWDLLRFFFKDVSNMVLTPYRK